ncbi:DNA methyltransferase [Agrobacterium radiobacter]|jgi:DNA modification methylase|uniref:Methyltransferase n=1 Tax=Agrobacterium tumefaciens str. B6 TaxID=1183423 RepID=A0A822V6M1_AGRTU|nr:DNA methyltransferase [Agrobacterium tumefaciens]KWT85651.1 DNA methyltransferase [Agrobacterium tumefaciens str. B6]MQB26241.1 DNA methylase [Agrobacterium tumefaciens]NTA07643.1 DNA methylase [Agrobacterium tumefaciens]NTA94040.1 DNA methylase [Agrobacterium tumefaciens]NTB15247.1 DNA methylase [Agrobacterium tumefaciens]
MRPVRNTVLYGDCISLMQRLPGGSVDFILTDPPYLVRYRDRHGRTVANDNNATWMKPAFAEMHRVLKPGGFAVSFYGWNHVDTFMDAWRDAGLRVVGHLVFVKPYASSRRFLQHTHEQAYVLAKGDAARPAHPMTDTLPWDYTGNRMHPTQKPLRPLEQIIRSLTRPGDLVLDPFCGSGSTLVAARRCGRDFLGVELEKHHHMTASLRVHAALP